MLEVLGEEKLKFNRVFAIEKLFYLGNFDSKSGIFDIRIGI